MKEWKCVQLGHHKKIAEVIEEHQKNGWCLHTYQAMGTPTIANHYLLFERDVDKKAAAPGKIAAAASSH